MKNENPSIETLMTMVMAFRGHNQTELSNTLGIAQSSLNRYIKGSPAKTKPSVDNYERLQSYMQDGLKDLGNAMFGSLNKSQKERAEKTVADSVSPYLQSEVEA